MIFKMFKFLLSLTMAAYPPMGETVVLNATGNHTHTIVFLHGIDNSGESMSYLFKENGSMQHDNLKAVLPTAPIIHWNMTG